MAADAAVSEIGAELPGLTARLATQVTASGGDNPELLDGTAGAALVLHTIGTGTVARPYWDAFLALA
jgi:hypothetical protein